jgi:EmrB/QacA subfamily drug resistance transporter
MRRPLILAACMIAMFMAAIEATIVATAIPSIVADLGGFSLFGWVFGAYLLAQAVTIPIYGRLADLYGRKHVLFVGIGIFLAGSTLCGFATSMPMLIVFRAFQGLGAGAIQPIASTIIGDIYSPTERARVQGYLSSVWGVAAVAGPVLGAFIVAHISWSLIFWLNLPIGIAAVAALAAFFPETNPHRPHAIDFPGAILLVLAVGLLMSALLQARALGWWLPAVLAAALACFAALIAQERSSSEPLLPLGLWKDPTIRAGNLGSLTIGASMMCGTAFLPIYIQGVQGRPVFEGGLALALLTIGWPLASTLAGRLMLVTSYRFITVLGGIVLLFGSLLLPLTLRGGGMLWPNVAAFLIGAGLGFCNSTFMVAVQSAAVQSLRGIATASTVFARMVGSALGTALLGAVLNFGLAAPVPNGADPVQTLMDAAARAAMPPDVLARLVAAVDAALHHVFWTGAVIAALACAAATLIPAGLRPGHAGLPPHTPRGTVPQQSQS